MNITEYEKGPMRLFASRTGAKDIVAIEGSVLGGDTMIAREHDMAPHLATALFDAGTATKSKDAIRSALSDRGISISFSSNGDRTYFRASSLPEDAEFVLKLIAECLKDSVFPAQELTLQKKRTLAEFEEAKTDTRSLASREFSRLIYDRDHVNFPDSLEEHIARTKNTSRAHLQNYKKLLGQGGLVLAVTGDVRPNGILKKAAKAFSVLPTGTLEMPVKKVNTAKPNTKESRITVADKANIDVFMGAPVPLTYASEEFLAFAVLTHMLGGGGLSNGHLMRTIRERDGLTYDIVALPTGFRDGADGGICIETAFSPAVYEKAVEATKREIENFLVSGITEDALLAKKGQLTGRYAVGLATSGGIARTLHKIGMEGKPLSYIDEYPSLVNALTVSDLKKVANLVSWDSFSIAAAGTFL